MKRVKRLKVMPRNLDKTVVQEFRLRALRKDVEEENKWSICVCVGEDLLPAHFWIDELLHLVWGEDESTGGCRRVAPLPATAAAADPFQSLCAEGADQWLIIHPKMALCFRSNKGISQNFVTIIPLIQWSYIPVLLFWKKFIKICLRYHHQNRPNFLKCSGTKSAPGMCLN